MRGEGDVLLFCSSLFFFFVFFFLLIHFPSFSLLVVLSFFGLFLFFSSFFFSVIFSKEPETSECPTTNSSDCHTIVAYKQFPQQNDGKERVTFLSPEGYGSGWNLRLIVTNSKTGQLETTDLPSNLKISYGEPLIMSVIIRNAASGSLFTVTITGENFCADQSCGSLKRCNTINGNATADTPNEPYCRANLEKSFNVGAILSWSHRQIIANVGAANGILYVQMGATNDIVVNGSISNMIQYSTNAMTIEANIGSDFVLDAAGLNIVHQSSLPVPTSGSTKDQTIYVSKLEQTTNVRVQVGDNSVAASSVVKFGTVWKVAFRIPPGSGPRNTVYVSKVSTGTK